MTPVTGHFDSLDMISPFADVLNGRYSIGTWHWFKQENLSSIDAKIKELGDWRGTTLAKVREVIHDGQMVLLGPKKQHPKSTRTSDNGYSVHVKSGSKGG
jgi:hypothetical protein